MGIFEPESDPKVPVETRLSAVLGHSDNNTGMAVATLAREAFSKVIVPAFERKVRRLKQRG